MLNMAGGKGLTMGQLKAAAKRGQVPKGIDRFDSGGGVKGEQDHVHFHGGAALNIDGTWKHGFKELTKAEKVFLQENGWTLPQ